MSTLAEYPPPPEAQDEIPDSEEEQQYQREIFTLKGSLADHALMNELQDLKARALNHEDTSNDPQEGHDLAITIDTIQKIEAHPENLITIIRGESQEHLFNFINGTKEARHLIQNSNSKVLVLLERFQAIAEHYVKTKFPASYTRQLKEAEVQHRENIPATEARIKASLEEAENSNILPFRPHPAPSSDAEAPDKLKAA